MAKKDAMGQEIDSLYLSLGLDIADLELGFKTAGQTVKQALSRLNSEAKQLQIKADIDVTKLEAAGKYVDALKAKEKALTDELAIQQKKLELLNRAYEANAKTYGKDSGITRGVDTKRLYQTRDIERLKAQLAQINAELTQTGAKSVSAFGKLGTAAAGARAKVEGITGAIKGINAGIAAASGAIAGGYGLFAITDKAMNAGENLHRLSQRLNITVQEASRLNKIFQLGEVDIGAITPLIANLDKKALSATKTTNALALAYGEFGFSLTDSKGALLSTTKQLDEMAKGYRNALKEGKGEKFIANVLGGRGAALAPLLENWDTFSSIADSVKGTGLLDTSQAHQAFMEWKAMGMQAGQLTGAIGQALLPVAKDLMPEITAGFREVSVAISDNKDAIKSFGSMAGDVIGTVTKSVGGLVVALGKVKAGWDDVTGLNKDEEVIRALGGGTGLDLASILGGAIGVAGGSRFGTKGAIAGGAAGSSLLEDAVIKAVKGKYFIQSSLGLGPSWEELEASVEREKYLAEEKADLEKRAKEQASTDPAIAQAILQRQQKAVDVQKQLEKELAETTNKRLKEQMEATKRKVQASIEAGKEEQEAWLDVEQSITEAIVNAEKQAKEANEELEKSIYSLTHTDLQNTLHGFDLSAKAAREKGADPELVEQEAQLKKYKAIEQFEKETSSYLDSIYSDSLTQRLNQIEREKKAWIQKGLDEVTATRAAEQQKRQATNDSVKSMFTSQKKYLDIYRRAMAGQIDNGMGGMLYDYTNNTATRQQNAVKMIQRAMMKEAGVSPWESTNMEELRGFQQAMKGAENWGLGLLKDGGAANAAESVRAALTESNSEITSILGQINTGVPEINSNLSQILGAIQQGNSNPPQITVSPSISVDLGGAYVFDNAMKKQLTDDITRDVADGVTQAVQQATTRINTGYGN